MSDENVISLQPGTVIASRYEVVKCLGQGSMGLVYACRHRELSGHLVAIKVLFPEVAQDNVAAARFRNEIVASYGVSHPNVVRAYEYFRDGDLVAYTMEYVGGGDLAERLSGGEPIAIPEVIRLLTQIAAGVQAIHDANIVHRDLKPENILLSATGEVKITDFGIARTGHGPKLTEHGGVVGTIDYVSPEYLEKGVVDARSDIYAVGVLAYEMLTGESPFRGDSVIATMTMRLRSDPKPPSTQRQDCPPELDRVILRALERDPEQRYQSMLEMFCDLQLLLPEEQRAAAGVYVHQPRHSSHSGQQIAAPTGGSVSSPLVEHPTAINQSARGMGSRADRSEAGVPTGTVVIGGMVVGNAVHNTTGNKAGYRSELGGNHAYDGGAFAGQNSPSSGQRVHTVSVTQPPLPSSNGGQSRPATEETVHAPLHMESVLSTAAVPASHGHFNAASAPVRIGQIGLDRGRIQTLSQAIGGIQRSNWVIDGLLVIVAVIIAFGLGLAVLSLFSPDLFREKKPHSGYDITVFDNEVLQ
jgi:serine/threonine protein kinase